MVVKLKDLSIDEIESLIYDTKDFIDLKRGLEEIGHKFNAGKKGLIKAHSIALRYWWKYRENCLPLESIPEKEPDYLPGSVVKNSCNTLKIVGIFHGPDGKNFSKFYRSKIAEMTKRDRDVIFYYESGFEREYIPKKIQGTEFISFDDHCVFSLSDALKLLGQFLVGELIYTLYRSKIGSVFLDEHEKIFLETERKIRSSRNPEKYILIAREVTKRVKLPPHLSLHYVNLVDGLYRKVAFERSNHMAHYVMEELLYGDCVNIYALVGQGHEGEIEYIVKRELEEYESPRDLEYLKFEK